MFNQINFQSFYTFEITLGILLSVTGFNYGFQISAFFLFLVLLGGILIFNGIKRWNHSQKNREKLENMDLDFDIKKIYAERDIEFIPENIIDGQPSGEWHAENEVKYEIELNIFNPSTIENVVRDIKVELKNKKGRTMVIKSSKDLNKIPIPIKGRAYERIIFNTGFSGVLGEDDDELKITLTTMDNKEIFKRKNISRYKEGYNLERGMR